MAINKQFKQLPGVLLPWYRENHRKLPWRENQDPYHIWLSEIMLQQTRVEAVKGYYKRFLENISTVEALASAPDDLLHKLWEGLGYYSRVRNLKKAAQYITQVYDGVFPQGFDDVLALPGIGDYTAGAICSIAFGQKTPAVDGNVLRVASRLTDDRTPIDSPAYKKAIRNALEEIYPDEAGEFTQALMELGATLCGPNKKPDCENCPCNRFCLAYQHGTAGTLPIKTPKKERRIEERTVLILECDGHYGLEKRPNRGLLAGLWQFPNVSGFLDAEDALRAVEAMGVKPRDIIKSIERKHIFTHIQWNMRGVYITADAMTGNITWMHKDDIRSSAALPTAFRMFFEEV